MTIERRIFPRLKIRVPIEISPDGSDVPIRGETTDLSAGGCYVETLFPLPVGTSVEARVRVGESTLIAVARVATSDPQVGNGISFVDMLTEDREELRAYLEAVAEQQEVTPKTSSAALPAQHVPVIHFGD